MKKINELSVKVTYKVKIGGFKVSDKVFEQLSEINEKGIEIDDTEAKFNEASEFLRFYIKQRDSYETEFLVNGVSQTER